VVAARPAHRRAVRPGAAGARDARGVVMAVIERAAKIVNPLGMHARPAAEFVKLAGRFKSAVEVKKDDLAVNGKSIMGVMMLAAECGSSLTIKVDGEDAEQAMEALLALVADGFHEMHLTAEVREAEMREAEEREDEEQP
jgi:phosphocarrier protein HPr